MRSPAITGDERPKGTSASQTLFFSAPNSAGSPVELDAPDPFGPRKRDQSSAKSGRATRIIFIDSRYARAVEMGLLLGLGGL